MQDLTGATATTFHDVLNPLRNERVSLRIDRGHVTEQASSLAPDRGRNVDGSALWLLPSLYDADSQLWVTEIGVRVVDLMVALHGGVGHINASLPWHKLAQFPLDQMAAHLASVDLPAITPMLFVDPDEDSAGFPSWITSHRDELVASAPPICKLYSHDPRFWHNLEAVWEADLLPIVFLYDPETLDPVLERTASRPVHFRHTTSAEMVARMKSVSNVTVQTCPHYLVPITGAHRVQLTVLPAVQDDESRESLTKVFLEELDVLVSDHNAVPIDEPFGPGLQTEQHLLQTVLTLCADNDWPLASALEKVTSGPARVFRNAHREGFVVVDPAYDEPVALWPGQTEDRAPFLGLPLKGRVLALGSERSATLV